MPAAAIKAPELATVGSDYGYVILVIGLSWVVNFFLSVQVVRARKTYDVQYPNLYAPESHKHVKAFNSVQRAHQNTLESWAPVMLTMMAVGLSEPKTSAACGAVWVLGRVLYGIGYASRGPQGRVIGAVVSHLGEMPLMVLALWRGLRMIGIF